MTDYERLEKLIEKQGQETDKKIEAFKTDIKDSIYAVRDSVKSSNGWIKWIIGGVFVVLMAFITVQSENNATIKECIDTNETSINKSHAGFQSVTFQLWKFHPEDADVKKLYEYWNVRRGGSNVESGMESN